MGQNALKIGNKHTPAGKKDGNAPKAKSLKPKKQKPFKGHRP